MSIILDQIGEEYFLFSKDMEMVGTENQSMFVLSSKLIFVLGHLLFLGNISHAWIFEALTFQ